MRFEDSGKGKKKHGEKTLVIYVLTVDSLNDGHFGIWVNEPF